MEGSFVASVTILCQHKSHVFNNSFVMIHKTRRWPNNVALLNVELYLMKYYISRNKSKACCWSIDPLHHNSLIIVSPLVQLENAPQLIPQCRNNLVGVLVMQVNTYAPLHTHEGSNAGDALNEKENLHWDALWRDDSKRMFFILCFLFREVLLFAFFL